METFKLEGIQVRGKTKVIYCPQGLSCWWESNQFDNQNPTAQMAFRLGANIVAYATGLKAPPPGLTPMK